MRKAVGVHLKKVGFWVFSQRRVVLTRRTWVVVRKRTFDYLRSENSEAVLILNDPGRSLWAVGGEFFWDTDGHDAHGIELIYWDRARRKDAKVERLQKIKARPGAAQQRRRELIPDETKIFVHSRDGGLCVKCGADEDIQYDHIIPVALGGASSIENLQLLCSDCNRLKSDSII